MKKKKFGFTVAELCITLGVIGIAAALTIPVFHTKAQEAKRGALLSAQVYNLETAYAQMLHVEGKSKLSDTEYGKKLASGDNDGAMFALKKYLKISSPHQTAKLPAEALINNMCTAPAQAAATPGGGPGGSTSGTIGMCAGQGEPCLPGEAFLDPHYGDNGVLEQPNTGGMTGNGGTSVSSCCTGCTCQRNTSDGPGVCMGQCGKPSGGGGGGGGTPATGTGGHSGGGSSGGGGTGTGSDDSTGQSNCEALGGTWVSYTEISTTGVRTTKYRCVCQNGYKTNTATNTCIPCQNGEHCCRKSNGFPYPNQVWCNNNCVSTDCSYDEALEFQLTSCSCVNKCINQIDPSASPSGHSSSSASSVYCYTHHRCENRYCGPGAVWNDGPQIQSPTPMASLRSYGCECSDSTKTYCITHKSCEDRNCIGGKIWSEAARACVCPDNMPVWDSSLEICHADCAAQNKEWCRNHRQCEDRNCPNPGQSWSEDTQSCECPARQTWCATHNRCENRNCIGNRVWCETHSRCENRSCTGGRTWDDNLSRCTCPNGKSWCNTHKRCEDVCRTGYHKNRQHACVPNGNPGGNNNNQSADYKSLSGGTLSFTPPSAMLSSKEGATLMFSYSQSENAFGTVYVDVNGTGSKPNRAGMDMFAFVVSEKGQLLPYGSREASQLRHEIDSNVPISSWSENGADAHTACTNARARNSVQSGLGCTSRLMEDGYKFNY